MPGRIGDPPCGEVAGTAQRKPPIGPYRSRPSGGPSGSPARNCTSPAPSKPDRATTSIAKRHRTARETPSPSKGARVRKSSDRCTIACIPTVSTPPSAPEMLEEITRRGGLSAPPHHDRPPRRGIHVESSDRTLVDPARTRHEAFRRHDLLEARQPLARKKAHTAPTPDGQAAGKLHRAVARDRSPAGTPSRSPSPVERPGIDRAVANSPFGALCRPPHDHCSRSVPTAAAIRDARPPAARRATTSDPHNADRRAGWAT